MNITLELISLKKCQPKWVPIFSLQVKNRLTFFLRNQFQDNVPQQPAVSNVDYRDQ